MEISVQSGPSQRGLWNPNPESWKAQELETIYSLIHYFNKCLKRIGVTWVAPSVKHLPLVQVVSLGSWDPALYWDPCSVGSLLLFLPLPPSLALSQISQ